VQGRPWEAVPFRRELIESLTSLRRSQYGDTEFCSPEYILWQLESGPAGRAVCWIALSEEGRVVGEYWMVPVRYLLGAREVLGAVGANALVHPKYRRRRVFQSLGRQCSAECTRRSIELTLYVPNQYSIGGLLDKFGCKDLGGIPVLVYPVDPSAIAQRVSSNQWVRRAAEDVLRWSRRTRRSGAANDMRVVPVSTCDFGPEFDDFWQRVLGKYPCMAIRDRSFMKWRYSSVGPRSYEARYARVGAPRRRPWWRKRKSGWLRRAHSSYAAWCRLIRRSTASCGSAASCPVRPDSSHTRSGWCCSVMSAVWRRRP